MKVHQSHLYKVVINHAQYYFRLKLVKVVKVYQYPQYKGYNPKYGMCKQGFGADFIQLDTTIEFLLLKAEKVDATFGQGNFFRQSPSKL